MRSPGSSFVGRGLVGFARLSRGDAEAEATGADRSLHQALLMPHEDKLGTLDGAAVLGGLYVEEG